MHFSMKVEMDNSSFEDPNQLVRILNRVISDYKQGQTGCGLYDDNGNRVGQWVLDYPLDEKDLF